MIKKCLLLPFFLLSLPAGAQLTFESDSLQNEAYNSTIQLSEVIVTSRAKNMQSGGLGNIRINPLLMKISPSFFGERDIVKTLQFLPGVSSGMEGSSQINIRGGTNDQTLYLLDDVPVYNQSHAFGFFSIFNADAINNVELYKGGIPTQYGGKLSGIVAVSLKDGDYKKHHTSVSLGLLAGTLASDGFIIKEKLSYNIAGRRSFVDLLYNGVATMNGNESSLLVGLCFYDINGKISWKINDRNHLSWQVYNGLDDLYVGQKKKEKSNKLTEKFGFGWTTFMTSLKYTSQLKPNLLYSNTVYYTTLDNFNYHRSKKRESFQTKEKTENGTSSLLTESGVKFSFEHYVSEKNKLFYGLEGSHQKFTPDYVFGIKNDKRTSYHDDNLFLDRFSGYINDEFNHRRWFLNAGIRVSIYDNSQYKRTVLEPRIKVNYYLNEKNKFMMAFDRMYQPVHTVNEMNYSARTDYWIPYREKILPESSQISLGWKNYPASRLTFSIEAYYKKMSNLLLIRNLEYYLDYHTDFETGKGTSKGLELMAEYAKNRFSVWTSYTLSKSDRTFKSGIYPFKYDAPHSINVFGNYQISKRENIESSVSLNMLYQTGYPYFIPNIEYPSPGLPHEQFGYAERYRIIEVGYIPNGPNTRLRDYFRTDLNYTFVKKLKRGEITWQLSLLNATGRNNPYAVYHQDGKYKALVMVPLLPSLSFNRKF